MELILLLRKAGIVVHLNRTLSQLWAVNLGPNQNSSEASLYTRQRLVQKFTNGQGSEKKKCLLSVPSPKCSRITTKEEVEENLRARGTGELGEIVSSGYDRDSALMNLWQL